MTKKDSRLFPHLNHHVVKGITGFNLDAYLIALEGWRRGLELKWYKDETELNTFNVLPGKTNGRFFSLSSRDKIHYFFCSRGDKVSNVAAKICRNKNRTKNELMKSGINVPQGALLTDKKEIISFAENIGYPVVIKPVSGSMGKGVYVNIKNKAELQTVLEELENTNKNKELIIEKYYPGKEYRVYVVGDKVVGAINRVPANVIGDGIHTIKELIELKNKERKKNPYLAKKPIKVDNQILTLLKKNGYNLDSIPNKGEQVFLREKSNLSQGGDPIEATDELSDSVKQLAVNALKVLPSIDHAGLDIIVNPNNRNEGTVIEINSKPEIAFHVFPLSGEPKDVPGAIIDHYFPETRGNFKTTAYFDYLSILEPLKTWAVDELKISKSPTKPYFKKTFRVKGQVQGVGYIAYIKRHALKHNLSGETKKINKDIEVTIIGPHPDILDNFKDIINKGSKKSKIEQVIETETEMISEPFKIGFKTIS